jgi:hypothetical protein
MSDANPTAKTNIIGFAKNSDHTTWRVISNDGSGTATIHKTLSSSFPANTSSTDLYFFSIGIPQFQSSKAYWHIQNLTTGATDGGVISTDLPATGQALNYQVWTSNGATAAVSSMDVSTIYISTAN